MIFRLVILCVALVLNAGCATTRDAGYDTGQRDLPEPESKGIYHKVNKGETLWRIAKTYNVPVRDIIKVNKIPSAAQIEENQLIFIPGAYTYKQIILDQVASKNDFIWPVQGKILQYFRQKQGFFANKGIDIEVPAGTQVAAARTGRVVFADDLTGHGKVVILDHQDGFHSVYAHNVKILVRLNEMVFRGSPVAVVGQNNRLAYLHFEIRKNSVEDNPLYYLP